MIERYALGCSFNVQDIIQNFPLKKLKLTCNQCKQIIGNRHRDKLISKIFIKSYILIINDIIDNNITFWFPLVGNRKCNMHMNRVEGNLFKHLRKKGKFKGVDIIKSMFSGFEIGFFMLGRRTPRVKIVYVDNRYKQRIVENVNNGFNYGDSKNDKTIKDYYEYFYEEYPTIQKQDIKRILNFCWKSLYLHNSYGGDTVIKNSNFWSYIGILKHNPLDHFMYYRRKLTVKIRVMYRRKKKDWDGYYYFALTDYQYQKYLEQKNKRGRPRKKFKFGAVYLYQILEECKVNESSKRYIFRIPYITRMKVKFFIRELITDKAELYMQKEPYKFKDILVINSEYKNL